MDFLTVEDINTILHNNRFLNEYYKLDTSKIQIEGEYTNVKYDFIKVDRRFSETQCSFNFIIENSLWCGGYYFTDVNGNYLPEDSLDILFDVKRRTITVFTDFSEIILVLYLNNIYSNFYGNYMLYKIDGLDARLTVNNHDDLEPPVSYDKVYLSRLDGQELSDSYTIGADINWLNQNKNIGLTIFRKSEGRVSGYLKLIGGRLQLKFMRGSGKYEYHYYYADLKKIKIPILLDYDLVVGKSNTVKINIPHWVKNTEYVKEIVVYINNKFYKLITMGTDALEFEVDLTNITTESDINLLLRLNGTGLTQNTEHKFKIRSHYYNASTFEELVEGVENQKFINLTDDIWFSNRLTISSDVIINGNGHCIDFIGCGFDVGECKVIFNDVILQFGGRAVVQEIGSDVEFNQVTFEACDSPIDNGLGAVLYCNTGINELDVGDDFKTLFNDCTFVNNKGCIYHGGELIVNKCRMLLDDNECVVSSLPAFLYQSDGEASIRDSIFDINLFDGALCRNHQSIGFNQCVVHIGKYAKFNGVSYDDLAENDKLPFFDEYNNQSHILYNSWFKSIEDCISGCPIEGYESKCVAWCLSNVDYVFRTNLDIFKHNTKVINEYNPIDWSDL